MPGRFKQWIDAKYVAWLAAQKRGERSQEAFAHYLGISRNTLLNYLNKGTEPGGANLIRLAVIYPDVFDALEDLSESDRELMQEAATFMRLPDTRRAAILKQEHVRADASWVSQAVHADLEALGEDKGTLDSLGGQARKGRGRKK